MSTRKFQFKGGAFTGSRKKSSDKAVAIKETDWGRWATAVEAQLEEAPIRYVNSILISSMGQINMERSSNPSISSASAGSSGSASSISAPNSSSITPQTSQYIPLPFIKINGFDKAPENKDGAQAYLTALQAIFSNSILIQFNLLDEIQKSNTVNNYDFVNFNNVLHGDNSKDYQYIIGQFKNIRFESSDLLKPKTKTHLKFIEIWSKYIKDQQREFKAVALCLIYTLIVKKIKQLYKDHNAMLTSYSSKFTDLTKLVNKLIAESLQISNTKLYGLRKTIEDISRLGRLYTIELDI